MKVYSSYKVKIKNYNSIFEDTVKIYREAVSFFIYYINNLSNNLQIICENIENT